MTVDTACFVLFFVLFLLSDSLFRPEITSPVKFNLDKREQKQVAFVLKAEVIS